MGTTLIEYKIIIPEWELENIAEILQNANLTFIEISARPVRVKYADV